MVSLFFVQNWSGFIVTIFYTVNIFRDADTGLNEFYATVLLGSVQVVGSGLGSLAVGSRLGRRCLLSASAGLCSASMAGLAAVLCLKEAYPESGPVQEAGRHLPVVLLVLFAFSFTLGLGPVPWVLVGELYPAGARPVAAGATTCACYLFIFTAGLAHHPMAGVLHDYGAFWLYSAVSLLGLVLCLAVVPETKGRSLQQIEAHFAGAGSFLDIVRPIPLAAEQEFNTVPQVNFCFCCLSWAKRPTLR